MASNYNHQLNNDKDHPSHHPLHARPSHHEQELSYSLNHVPSSSSLNHSFRSRIQSIVLSLKHLLGPMFFNKGFFNVVNLGASFFLLFAAFGTTQSFITTLRKSEGFVSLSILYFVFAFSNLVAPSFTQLFSPKWTCVLGALCYCLFVFAAGFDSSVLLYCASVVNGFGAALLWTGQGTLLTQSANLTQMKIKEFQMKNGQSSEQSSAERQNSGQEKEAASGNSVEVMGFFSGVFFALFQLNSIFGNILAGSLFSAGLTNFQLFFVLTIIALVGSLSLIALMPIKKSEYEKKLQIDEEDLQHDNIHIDTRSFTERISNKIKNYFTQELAKQAKDFVSLLKQAFLVLFSKKMLVFSIISFYSGYSNSYFTGSLPPIIGRDMLGWVMILFGISQVSGALISGKMLDKIGRRVTMLAAMFIHCVAVSLSTQFVYWGNSVSNDMASNQDDPSHTIQKPAALYLLFFVNMSLFGLSDSFLTNSIYGILGSPNYYKKKNTAEAFAAFKMTQSLSSAIGFFCGIYLNVVTIQIILAVSFGAWLVAFFVMDNMIAPVDKKQQKHTSGKKQHAVVTSDSPLLQSNNNSATNNSQKTLV
ncbi:hypothetical protein C9374_012688 [Naegleria lovaniensis]|uniref:UNC93-like protein MFSD11 n=1 Tax=Naegleria lovaniensis TaxID=51637 RepID=A0AA88KQF6_NAELO|nr:uncharacterized protein C9374_012688 [Naegleria lovaniensis]KAG2392436.1 hypothetical protein C9374_012688 [Naegleria lovaniensis]